MTVALVRRLVWEGVVAPEEVQRALHAHVTRRVAFLKVLCESRPDLVDRLETELGHQPGPSTVIADGALLRALPPELPAALLAVPTGKDPKTGVVRVAAADSSDLHVASEFSYHLGAQVEVWSAPLRAVLAAIAPKETPSSPRQHVYTPAFGVPAGPPSSLPPRAREAAPPAKAPAQRPSEPPIPLVRLSPEPVQGPSTVKGVAPQATGLPRGVSAPVVVAARTSAPLPVEPVIQLTRQKSLAPPSAPDSSPPATIAGPPTPSAPHAPAPAPADAPSSPRASTGASEDEEALRQLSNAATADEVASALARGLSRSARRVLVLAARGKVFEGRDAHDDATRAAVRSLVISADRPSVLLTAVQAGQYFGPIPQTLVHQPLAEILGSPGDEIAVGVVTVSGRAALVFVMSGLATAYLATRRGDALAEAASRALERIVRGRKR